MKRGMPPELVSLLERFNQLGRLLPRDDFETAFENTHTRADAEIILREMTSVKAQIDLLLTAAARERSLN